MMIGSMPYLSDDRIERDAELLLAEYANYKGIEISAPIPIEDITEKVLKLRLEFDDLHQRLGVPRSSSSGNPDILGAIFVRSRTIVIDESLDPEEWRGVEERCRFTLAHECGHWRLHRRLVPANVDQAAFLSDRRAVGCRLSKIQQRVECQANLHAACVLMPRRLVLARWQRHGQTAPVRLSDLRPTREMLRRIDMLVHEQKKSEAQARADVMFERAVDLLARYFRVSRSAMRIRLETLGQLLRSA